MTKILSIDSSANPMLSVSRQLSLELRNGLKAKYPDAQEIYYDVVKEPYPFFTPEVATAWYTAPADRDTQQQKIVALSDRLINEIKDADHLIISSPMYNLGIPAQLKTWIDQIVRVNETFKYNADGSSTGLLNPNKTTLYIVSAFGGTYDGDAAAYNMNSQYVGAIMGWLGLTNQKHIMAQGLNMGEDARNKGIKEASAQIQAVLK